MSVDEPPEPWRLVAARSRHAVVLFGLCAAIVGGVWRHEAAAHAVSYEFGDVPTLRVPAGSPYNETFEWGASVSIPFSLTAMPIAKVFWDFDGSTARAAEYAGVTMIRSRIEVNGVQIHGSRYTNAGGIDTRGSHGTSAIGDVSPAWHPGLDHVRAIVTIDTGSPPQNPGWFDVLLGPVNVEMVKPEHSCEPWPSCDRL